MQLSQENSPLSPSWGRGRIVTPWNVLSHLLRLRAVPSDEIQGSGDSGKLVFKEGNGLGCLEKAQVLNFPPSDFLGEDSSHRQDEL